MTNQIPINRIFCCFPIFCPSEKMFQRNMASVVSFVEYVKLNSHLLTGERGIILDCYFGGWSLKDEWYNEIQKYIKENLPVVGDNLVKVFRFDKNYGKSSIINSLSYDYNIEMPDTQFMYTSDSDIKMMNSQIHFFDRLLLAAKMMEEVGFKTSSVKKPFSFVSLNQNEECCHWFLPQSNGAKGMDLNATYEIAGEGFKINEEIVWPSDQMGIAGGSLFVNFLWFKKIGGYRKFNTIYAGDDGFLLADSYRTGALPCIIKTLSIIHPHNDDSEQYSNYKKESMKHAFDQYDETKYTQDVEKSEKIH